METFNDTVYFEELLQEINHPNVNLATWADYNHQFLTKEEYEDAKWEAKYSEDVDCGDGNYFSWNSDNEGTENDLHLAIHNYIVSQLNCWELIKRFYDYLQLTTKQ